MFKHIDGLNKDVKNPQLEYSLDMALEHMRRIKAELDDPYYIEWIEHCRNEYRAFRTALLKEFCPERG